MPSLIGKKQNHHDGSMPAHDVIGVVGPMHSDSTEQVANLLGMFKIPQVSLIFDDDDEMVVLAIEKCIICIICIVWDV